MIALSDQHLDQERTVCIIRPDNEASIRVAKKCGYVEVSTLIYKETPVLLFERKRP